MSDRCGAEPGELPSIIALNEFNIEFVVADCHVGHLFDDACQAVVCPFGQYDASNIASVSNVLPSPTHVTEELQQRLVCGITTFQFNDYKIVRRAITTKKVDAPSGVTYPQILYHSE